MTKEEKKENIPVAESQSFEQAMGELENITKKLESGNLELDEAIKIYEKGSSLINFCEKKLNSAKLKVEKIVKGEGGDYKLEEFNN